MREIKTFGWMLGLSLLGFAQPSGEKAVGVVVSKDGLRALSARFASPANPALNLALTAGVEVGRGFTGGLALQQYFNPDGACAGGACRRRTVDVVPYIEGGVRVRQSGEAAQVDILGHLGAGILLPLGPVEPFAQANLYKSLSPTKPGFDLVGGIRIRF